ncbi:MAG: MerR family transcriptional regulator [Chitinophagaceae bacterium]|jgi:DNA-binding transcriptional MerR regulator|nr:MerR family transcriptional regulator [Chitinophagaceae bacterium]
MLQQLDIFAKSATEETTAETIAPVAERRLKPPVKIVAEEETPEAIKSIKAAVPPVKKEEKQKKGQRGRKSIKDMSLEAEFVEVPADDVLFTKQYYPIGEVAEMFKVNASLLRYWETEFDILKPRKNRKGDRYFRPEDVKNLQLIYHLLRQRKYTIEGAKDYLKKNKKSQEKYEMIQKLQQIKSFFLELKATL